MTPKQRRFVEEYLVDLNARQAALRAGYSDRSAHSYGCQLLRRSEIKAAIEAGLAVRSRRTRINGDQVLTELGRIAFADLRDVVEWGPEGVILKSSNSLTPDAARAVAEVIDTRTRSGGSLRVKLFDKRAALEALARHLGMTTGVGAEGGHNLPPLRVIIQEATKTRPVEALRASPCGPVIPDSSAAPDSPGREDRSGGGPF